MIELDQLFQGAAQHLNVMLELFGNKVVLFLGGLRWGDQESRATAHEREAGCIDGMGGNTIGNAGANVFQGLDDKNLQIGLAE